MSDLPAITDAAPVARPLERVVFFGTPAFAVPTLDALHRAGRTPILVVSQPTRGAGRGRRVKPPPVAAWALEHGVELLQPKSVKRAEFITTLEELAPDVAVVVAFGQIFPQRLLDVPIHGCINVHASLLPRHRGAAPIAAAILAGDRETGVGTMVMEAGLDSGPVLLERRVEIGERATTGELTERLADLGAELLVETLARLEAGDLEAHAQPEQGVTLAPMIEKSEGRIDWRLSAKQIDRRIRAFDPWPGSTGWLRERPLKILQARPLAGPESGSESTAGSLRPGAIVAVGAAGIDVECGGGGVLRLERVQRPGRRAVGAGDLVNGERLEAGECFGVEADEVEVTAAAGESSGDAVDEP